MPITFAPIAFAPNGRWVAVYANRCLWLADLAAHPCLPKVLDGLSLKQFEFSGDRRRLMSERSVTAVDNCSYDPSAPVTSALTNLFMRDDWITYAGRDIL